MNPIKLALVFACSVVLFFPAIAVAQSDPGVRSNTGVNAGQPLASVTANANDLAFFQTGLAQFNEHQTVTGDNPGLGPRFNLDSCGGCHSQPAPGGTSPASGIFPNIGPNPQSQVNATPLTQVGERTFEVYLPANAKIDSVLAAGPEKTGMAISGVPVLGEPGHYTVSFPTLLVANEETNLIRRSATTT